MSKKQGLRFTKRLPKKQGSKLDKVARLQKQSTLMVEKQLSNFMTACVQYAMEVLVEAKETCLKETGVFQRCEWMFWS